VKPSTVSKFSPAALQFVALLALAWLTDRKFAFALPRKLSGDQFWFGNAVAAPRKPPQRFHEELYLRLLFVVRQTLKDLEWSYVRYTDWSFPSRTMFVCLFGE
jgi:hypothetical protein